MAQTLKLFFHFLLGKESPSKLKVLDSEKLAGFLSVSSGKQKN